MNKKSTSKLDLELFIKDYKSSKVMIDKNYNPESALWKAVITQSIMDLVSYSKRSSQILARDQAKDWLSLNNKNFLQVCDFAGLNPEWVLKKVRYALSNPKIWRRDCDLKNWNNPNLH